MQKLNPRERVLVMLIVVAVPLCLVPLLGLSAYNSYRDKQKLLLSLENRKSDLELNRMRWERAERRRQDYQKLSLPGLEDAAISDYKGWLLVTGESIFGTDRGLQVQHGNDVSRSLNNVPVYREGTYTMKVRGTLPELLEFLEVFYKLDCLHRVTSLKVTPQYDLQTREPTKELDINVRVEALSLDGAEPSRDLVASVELDDPELHVFDADKVAEWKDDILRRNIFAYPNNAPRLSRIGTKRFEKGERMSVRISARDEDDGDALSFELVDGAGDGVELEHDEGDDDATLVLPDLDIGTYKFAVAVRDDGYPPKEDIQEFEIEVEEPEAVVVAEPEPEFDPSGATYITAVVRDRNGSEQVFLHIKPTGEMLKLVAGDSFTVGSVKGSVLAVIPGSAIFEINGEQREVKPGDRLSNSTTFTSSRDSGDSDGDESSVDEGDESDLEAAEDVEAEAAEVDVAQSDLAADPE